MLQQVSPINKESTIKQTENVLSNQMIKKTEEESDGTWTRGLSDFEFQKLKLIEDVEQQQETEQEENLKEDDTNDPSLPADIAIAKKYIQTANKITGYNLYDHLAKIIIYLLDHRPDNAADIIEEISLDVSQRKRKATDDEVLQAKDNQVELATAKMHLKLFESAMEIEAIEEEEGAEPGPNKDLMESAFYFQQLEVGIETSSVIRIALSMKKLISEKELTHARFFGKIIGLEQDYYIVEADYMEGEDEEEEEEAQEEQQQQEPEEDNEQQQEEVEEPLPKINFKPPKPVPKEEPGEGANKKIYFVSNDPGKVWSRLPLVTPQQIFAAKKKKVPTATLR